MAEQFPLMIANSKTPSSSATEVFSPYNGELLAQVENAQQEHIEQALRSAHRLFKDRKQWLSVCQRQQILEKTAALMQADSEALALSAAAEGGKPLIDSRVEVSRAIAGVKLCAEHIGQHSGEVVPMVDNELGVKRMAFTQKEPIGVVVAVSAFNHPLNLIVHQVGAAIAAGCPVIVKPASETCIACLRFVALLRQAGLADSWCQVVLPENLDLATALVSDARVGFFSFIGSAKVGWMLNRKLAPGTRSALEHGGVAPVIVDKSADINKLIPALLKGGFYHAGQVCVSVQRVYLPENLIDSVAGKLVEGANALIVGDPLSAQTEVGPLIRAAEVERIHSWVQEAQQQGAELLCGGKVLENNCYAPTVLLNPSQNSTISQNEVFGPVVCLYSYQKVEDAIALANSLDVVFQAAVFSQDIDAATAIYQQLDASAVMVNDHTAFRQDGMPFAGLRHSGLGVGGIGHTIDDMQIDKMMMIKTALV